MILEGGIQISKPSSSGSGKGINSAKNIEEESLIANPIPARLARVVPNTAETFTTLGLPNATDVFVSGSSDIKGMNASQIANRLTMPQSSSGYKIFEFNTPFGIASPINRTNPGFIGGGRTLGGAREFVIPNQPIPKG